MKLGVAGEGKRIEKELEGRDGRVDLIKTHATWTEHDGLPSSTQAESKRRWVSVSLRPTWFP